METKIRKDTKQNFYEDMRAANFTDEAICEIWADMKNSEETAE